MRLEACFNLSCDSEQKATLTFVVVFSVLLVLLVVLRLVGLVLGRADGPWSPQRPGRQHRQRPLGAGAQPERDGVLGRLLPLQRHLRGHDALPLSDQVALGAVAVLESAVTLVTLEPGDHAVVPASRALGLPGALLGERVQWSRELAGGQHLHHLYAS